LLAEKYSTVGFSQNKYSDIFFQAGKLLNKHYPKNMFNLNQLLTYNLPTINNDPYLAFSSLDKVILLSDKKTDPGSLFLGPMFEPIKI